MSISAYQKNMSKREANKLANTQAIQAAALDVFCEQGYDACTITDIVEASGLSVGTFYNYYGDKASLLTLIMDQIFSEARTALHHARMDATTPDNFIRDAFTAFIRVLREKPNYLRFIKKNTHNFRQAVTQGDELAGVFSDLNNDMQDAIDAGLLPVFDTQLMTAAMIGASIEVFSMADHKDENELAEFLSKVFIGGIANMAG